MDVIEGGSFNIARKIFESDVWLNKPSQWKVIWIYILGKVNHEPRNGLGRGVGFFNFSKVRKDIGNDITIDQIKHFMGYARAEGLVRTKRSTRGMLVKVLKYSYYQDFDNYKRTNESTSGAREKHLDTQELEELKNKEESKEERVLSESELKKEKEIEDFNEWLLNTPDDEIV